MPLSMFMTAKTIWGSFDGTRVLILHMRFVSRWMINAKSKIKMVQS